MGLVKLKLFSLSQLVDVVTGRLSQNLASVLVEISCTLPTFQPGEKPSPVCAMDPLALETPHVNDWIS